MAYGRPGTYVNEQLLTQSTPVNSTTAVGVFLAPALRGPTAPTLFQSWTAAQAAFGGFTGVPTKDVLLQALYDYFNNGGRTAYTVRVVGSSAASASLTVLKAVSPGPGPSAAVFTAPNPGVWGNSIYLEVVAGSTVDRFSLNIRVVPTGAAVTAQQIVETWTDLSLNPADPRYAAGILNNATGGSNYVVFSLAGGYTYTALDSLAVSTVSGGNPLASGADGTAPTTTQIASAVYTLDAITHPFVLNLPGETRLPVISAVAGYTDASMSRGDGEGSGRGDVFVVVDSDPGVTGDAAITTSKTYPRSDVLAQYYPQLLIGDPSNTIPGATKLVPAGPSVVGRYIATDAARGTFKAPAGVVDGRLNNVLGLDPAAVMKNTLLDRLNNAAVNAIKSIPNRGFVVFGARTLKSDYVTRYVSSRRCIIDIRAQIIAATDYAPFENNDSILWAGLANQADKICRQVFAAGGLKGSSAEAAYYVKCDSDNNTLATIEAGEVHLEVGLAVLRPAEFVVLTISQFEGGAAVTESLNAAVA